jgi:hypothetical protein
MAQVFHFPEGLPFENRYYTGWISPQGEFTMLDQYQHETFAEDKVEELGYEHEGKMFGDVLRDKGWLRIVTSPGINDLWVWPSTSAPKAGWDRLYDLSIEAEKRGHTAQSEWLHKCWKDGNP